MNPRPPRPAAGLTLIEMVVVIGLIALLLGLGVSSYFVFSRNFTEEGYVSHLDVMLRQVRNSAIGSRAPAYLEIDTEHKRITPWATRVIALWHFETCDEFGHTTGPNHNAVLRGARQVADGKIGKCVHISSGSYVDAGGDPDFDLDDGGSIEAYIKPDAGSVFLGESYIFCKNGSYSLRIGARGVLIGEIGATKTTPAVRVFCRTYKIVPGRWTKVALAWDRNLTRLMADDTIIATGAGARAPLTLNPLWIGHESGSMDGMVDEVRILAAVSGGSLDLPRFDITHNTAPWNAVYFAEDGTLDLRFHPGPVRITLERDRRARAVNVSMFGTTTRTEVEKLDKLDTGETVEDRRRRDADQARKIKLLDGEKAGR